MDVDYLRIYQLTSQALANRPRRRCRQQPRQFGAGGLQERRHPRPHAQPTNGLYWNNVLITQTGGGAVPINGSSQPMELVDAAKADSGMTLAITSTGWGAGACPEWADYNGTYGYPAAVNSTNFPSTALRDGILVSGGATMTVTSIQQPVKAAEQLEDLSSRERQILELLVQGSANKEIAEHIGLSETTVRWPLRNVYRKLQCAPARRRPSSSWMRDALGPHPCCLREPLDSLNLESSGQGLPGKMFAARIGKTLHLEG